MNKKFEQIHGDEYKVLQRRKDGEFYYSHPLNIGKGASRILGANNRVSVPPDFIDFCHQNGIIKIGDVIGHEGTIGHVRIIVTERKEDAEQRRLKNKEIPQKEIKRLDKNGRPALFGKRITIPSELADKLNMTPGDYVRFFIYDGRLCYDKATM